MILPLLNLYRFATQLIVNRFYKISLLQVELVPSDRKTPLQPRKVVAPRFEKKTRQKISDYLKQMATPEIEAVFHSLYARLQSFSNFRNSPLFVLQ